MLWRTLQRAAANLSSPSRGFSDLQFAVAVSLEQFKRGLSFRCRHGNLCLHRLFLEHGRKVLLTRYFEDIEDHTGGKRVNSHVAPIRELKHIPLRRLQHTENRLGFRG